MATGYKPVVEEAFLKKLENLNLIVKRHFRGRLGGTHTSPRAGISLEFAEYKEYYPGDDFRTIDWNIYGRLEKLAIKSFKREEDVPIYILLDTSKSMALGGKLDYAVKLAATIAYLGLVDLNRVSVYAFGNELISGVPPKAGARQIFHIFKYLSTLTPTSKTNLNAALEGFAKRRLETGLLILLSDMLSEGGFTQGLSQLLFKRFELLIVQILAPEDLDPGFEGEVEITDIEDAQAPKLPAAEDAKQAYKTALADYLNELDEFCLRRNIRRALLSTSLPIEAAIFDKLRGVLFK